MMTVTHVTTVPSLQPLSLQPLSLPQRTISSTVFRVTAWYVGRARA